MGKLIDADALKKKFVAQRDKIEKEKKYGWEFTVNGFNGAIFLTGTEAAQNGVGWIPCSERLPEEDFETGDGVQYSEHVAMTVYNEMDDETFVDNGYTINGEWISDTTDNHIPRYWNVLAWQPMPEPWKGEQQ